MNEKSKRLMALFESLDERSKDILLLQAEAVREAQEAFKADTVWWDMAQAGKRA
jgi:hypothetical protein